MITVEKLNKSFGSLHVLKDIDLTVAEKEVVVVIGPSGSGKSTLLRCLNYMEEPSSGTIIIDEINLNSSENYSHNHTFANLTIDYTIQDSMSKEVEKLLLKIVTLPVLLVMVSILPQQ